MREAVGRANAAIRRMARDDPDKSGMGTTFTAAMLEDGRLDVVHVGDSRAYLWRDGKLRQLTEDHSVVAELVKRGSISPEDAEHHPHRNVITRALGAEAEVVVDSFSEYLRDGDVVLLCSDGLSSYVAEEDIAEVLGDAVTLADAAKALVERANRAGGTDNVTVVLARVGIVGDGESGSTAEVPVVGAPAADGDPGSTAEMKVLGGVHGATGAARPGGGDGRQEAARAAARPPPAPGASAAGARGGGGGAPAWWPGPSPGSPAAPTASRSRPTAAWWSSTACRSTSPASTCRPTGRRPRSRPRPCGRPTPAPSRRGAQGQGEAVELAAGLVWRFGLPQTPVVRLPARDTAPERAPAPATPEPTPG